MAVGGIAAVDYSGGVTVPVAVICLIAASCGLILGYDVGVTGGVTQMESFLKMFFPKVLRGVQSARRDAYCKYDNQLLTAFTSSLYLASAVSSMVASRVTRRVGRQTIMLIGGILFLVGSIINAAAVNAAMLIIGRLLLGFGVGFTAQAAPLYVAEVSPARWRGGFTAAYHSFLCAGTMTANAVNYFTNPIPDWGWRVSLGAAAVPAIVIVVGALYVPDTPSSLMLRGKPDEARASLQRIRGADADVDAEFKEIVSAAEEARRHEDGGALKRLRSRGYRPYTVIMVAISTCFDFTGFIVIFVFAPVLFRTVGFSSDKALLGTIIINMVGLFAVILSNFAVDRYGRRFLFISGGISMLLCQVATSWILAEHLGKGTMAHNYAQGVVVLLCLYTFSLQISWGPLKWVVWGEINPLDVRSVAQAMSLSVTYTLSFIQSQVFLALLCHLRYATFLFYAAWLVAMTVFIAAFLPETKGVPLEAMGLVFARHWYWNKFINHAPVSNP